MKKEIEKLLKLAAEYEHELPAAPPALKAPQGAALAGWIDHTLLKPDATAAQVRRLCEEAGEHRFASVCINPIFVPLAVDVLKGTQVPVCVVVGFPLGAAPAAYKVVETMGVLAAGAREVDMVISVGALKGGDAATVYNEIAGVVQVAHSQEALVKVIIEAGLLTRSEKISACLLSKEAGADFVKTSTGMMAGGATVVDGALMRGVVGAEVGVKGAGGIRTYADTLAMIAAGANRIGASAGIKIVEEAQRA